MKLPSPPMLLVVAITTAFAVANAADKKPPLHNGEKQNTAPKADPAKPQYGAWGFDTEGADLKSKAGDDFFRYANGHWLDRVQIPADKPGYSLRLAMTDAVEERLHGLMEEAAAKSDAHDGIAAK